MLYEPLGILIVSLFPGYIVYFTSVLTKKFLKKVFLVFFNKKSSADVVNMHTAHFNKKSIMYSKCLYRNTYVSIILSTCQFSSFQYLMISLNKWNYIEQDENILNNTFF